MIVPSIDLMGGETVQLVGGAAKALDAGDPRQHLERFQRVGEVAVVDLDAALGRGDNRALIEDLVRRGPCRVGGGIRSVAAAREWLAKGAAQVVLGTAARPDVLSELPRERVVAALDCRHGEVVVKGWTEGTGQDVLERVRALRGLVGGFLVTFVENEGRLTGIDLERVRALKEAAGGVRLTIAGGVRSARDVAALDALGVEAQVGMALYTGRLSLGESVAACLKSDRPDGLWPTVVCDEGGRALGLCYSDRESLEVAIERGVGAYRSRRRGLWIKGETSGATQELLSVDVDCDRDALRFVVRQGEPGFCHQPAWTCWGDDRGLPRLERRLAQRTRSAPAGSYTARLLGDPQLLAAKLREEAGELAEARDPQGVADEAADLVYFASVALARAGVPWSAVERALDRREGAPRRAGDAKPGALRAPSLSSAPPSEPVAAGAAAPLDLGASS